MEMTNDGNSGVPKAFSAPEEGAAKLLMLGVFEYPEGSPIFKVTYAYHDLS